jgi:hypothetical protein
LRISSTEVLLSDQKADRASVIVRIGTHRGHLLVEKPAKKGKAKELKFEAAGATMDSRWEAELDRLADAGKEPAKIAAALNRKTRLAKTQT